MATENYQRFFDSSFRPLLYAGQITHELKVRDAAVALNNRAVMARIKVMTHKLGLRVSEHENQEVLNLQEKLLDRACTIEP